jgi:DNA repair exonuclease SbcCD ATPase subunit
VKSAMEAKTTLEDDKVMVTQVLADKESSDIKLNELKKVKEDFDNYNSWTLEQSKYKRYQSEIEVKMANCQLNIQKADQIIKDTQDDISEYNRNKKAILHNKDIQSKIDKIRDDIAESKNDVSECRVDIQTTYGKMETTKQTITNIEKLISDAHHLEIKLKAFDFYLLAMHRDGISYEIISNLMPIVEDEVNEILEQIVDFKIEFNVDGKNIVSYICYGKDKWPLSITSGMEKFLASIAIRVALTKVSCLPRPNFLIIDEGFGNLDSENLRSLEHLFEYLMTEYDFVMIVSHIDVMKDMVEELIEIDTTSGHSLIQY